MEPENDKEESMRAVVSANLAWNLGSRKNLFAALKAEGYEVFAVATPDGEEDRVSRELDVELIPIGTDNKGTNPLKDIASFLSYARIYRRIKPDVVLHFNGKPCIYGSLAAKLLGIPCLNTVTGLGSAFDRTSPMQTVVRFLYRLAFSGRYSWVFFQNSDDRSLFAAARIVDPRRTEVVPGSGVDVARFKPQERPATSGRAVTFLFSSRLVLTKGIREYIEAARLVRETGRSAEFAVIGESLVHPSFVPPDEIARAEREGVVRYGGNQADVISWMRDVDCVVLPSYYREGIPRVLLEGAAMGKPLIAADSVGTREPVRDGLNGYLVPPRDVRGLANAMIRVIDAGTEGRAEMGRQSRLIAEREYSDRLVIARYIARIQKGTTT